MGDTGGDTEKYYHEVGLTRDQVTSVTNQNTASGHVTAILISSAANRLIGFTIGFHNHGEGPY